MAIRSPKISVAEAKQLARGRLDASNLAEGKVTSGEPATGAWDDANHTSSIELECNPSAPPPTGYVFDKEASAEPKEQIFLSAPLPAPGVSKSFDRLSKQYPPRKALQMILRRALDLYDPRLDDGSYQAAPSDYPISRSDGVIVIQTSRMMPVRLLEIARSHFDPLGFESARAFGRKLACGALASFFDTERQRQQQVG